MADISVTVTIGAQAENELNTYLVTINMQRAASGLDAYANLQDWAQDTLRHQLKQWRREYVSEQANTVRQAYEDASAATRAQVRNALGI